MDTIDDLNIADNLATIEDVTTDNLSITNDLTANDDLTTADNLSTADSLTIIGDLITNDNLTTIRHAPITTTQSTPTTTTRRAPTTRTINNVAAAVVERLHPKLNASYHSNTRDPTFKREVQGYFSTFTAESLTTVSDVLRWCLNEGEGILYVRKGRKWRYMSVELFQEWIEAVRRGEASEHDIFKEGMEWIEWWMEDGPIRRKPTMEHNDRHKG